MPKVSIVMISYHQRRDWFMEAMTSIWKQTYQDKEIILSAVRGSPEIEWAKAFDGVKVVDNSRADAKEQINTGIKFAGGEYVIHVASDDYFYPTAIEDMVKVAVEKNSVLVYSDMHYCDEDLRLVMIQRAPEFKMSRLKQLQIMGDCSLVKKSVLWEFGLFKPEWKKFAIWDMWLKIAEKYPNLIHRTGKVMCKYRRHPNSLSIRAFRGDLEGTGEGLRKKFFESHGLTPTSKTVFNGNEICTEFANDCKIILDNN